MSYNPDWFIADYAASRARFRADLHRLQARWPGAHRMSQRHDPGQDLTTDWITAPARLQPDRLLLFTTAEHGIEGYVGSAMLQVFLEEFLPRLDADRTSLLLVHAINPWGMQHHRRVNAGNVDLNRTFLWRPDEVGDFRNPGYEALSDWLNPQRPVAGLTRARQSILARLHRLSAKLTPAGLRTSIYLGQYHLPGGVYYGGGGTPAETRLMMELYRAHLAPHRRVVHLDIHTGYGPRYQMSLVNSPLEPRASADLQRTFGYPLVVKATADEFYPIHGDMVDYVCRLARETCPETDLYATSFEFGTFGDSGTAILRSMRAVILENQLAWHGADSPETAARVRNDFEALFNPAEARWRAKAVEDARLAMQGILAAQGFLA